MRKAKIVATLGPSSDTIDKIAGLIERGVDVVRLNMSHGDHTFHKNLIKNIREASLKVQKEVAILMDLQGPKIRVDKLENNLELKKDEEWVIGPNSIREKYKSYQDKFIPTVYKDLVKDAHVGCKILFDDGLIEARAVKKNSDILTIKVLVGGTLKSNKGINLPDAKVSAPSFTEKDHKDLLFGLREKVDYVALSFVRTKEDILQVKYLLHQLKKNVPIVAKIERPEAVDNIEAIASVANVIMVARGDMGVELGNHLVPFVQKKIINHCNSKGVPVITATQMLESMIHNSTPTRAEASDVANAIWDGTDAVMLSGETASGKYPFEAVAMMNKIIEETEKHPKERPYIRNMDLSNVTASQMVAASLIAEKTFAKWIISVTQSGNSCLKISRFRPRTDVLGVTNSQRVVRKMCLYWGVTPFYFKGKNQEDLNELENEMLEIIKAKKNIENGDKIVITHGDGKYFHRWSSNTIRTEIVKDAHHGKSNKKGQDDTIIEVAFPKGKIQLDTSICSSCQSCINACPHDIWTTTTDDFRKTIIDEKRAPECSLDLECMEVCPTGAIEIIVKN